MKTGMIQTERIKQLKEQYEEECEYLMGDYCVRLHKLTQKYLYKVRKAMGMEEKP